MKLYEILSVLARRKKPHLEFREGQWADYMDERNPMIFICRICDKEFNSFEELNHGKNHLKEYNLLAIL